MRVTATSPNRIRPRLMGILVILLFVAIAASCRLPNLQMSAPQKSSGGTLELTISGNTARTLLPAIDMNIASYQIKGTGPGAATFSENTTKSNNQFVGLAVGTWNIAVAGINAAGQNIGIGANSVDLSPANAVSLSVTVDPIQGIGTLGLTTTWPTASVASPSISASLLPPAGPAIPLAYTIGSGTASVTNSSIPSGYYTLSQTLMDGSIAVMGAVEVVRIVAGQTTSGTFDFSNLNAADPTVELSITPVMNEPLTVSLTGESSSINYGGSMTVTPSETGYSGNVTYAYYLNGTAVGSTTSASPAFTLGSNLAPGNYRLDVTAYSADGLQAGSASTDFTVAVPTGSVVLAFNAASDSTITGYKIYYGTASGSYTSSVDAGTKTMVEVSGLQSGTTYFFAAVSYNSAGVQSAYSNEISYAAP